jgi:hypothetical protein
MTMMVVDLVEVVEARRRSSSKRVESIARTLTLSHAARFLVMPLLRSGSKKMEDLHWTPNLCICFHLTMR